MVPVAGGACSATLLLVTIECVDGEGRPLWDQHLVPPSRRGRAGPWHFASSGDILVLVSEDQDPHLAVYRPAEDRSPVTEARLGGPPFPDRVVYQPGLLVLFREATGRIAVYADAG
jgi:hypothetical protein